MQYTAIEDEQMRHPLSVEDIFFLAHEKSLAEEGQEKEARETDKKNTSDEIKHPILSELLNEDRKANFDPIKVDQLYNIAIQGRVAGNIPYSAWELFAVDLILYYYDKIVATPEDTKTTVYKRLHDCVKKDYDHQVIDLLMDYKR